MPRHDIVQKLGGTNMFLRQNSRSHMSTFLYVYF